MGIHGHFNPDMLLVFSVRIPLSLHEYLTELLHLLDLNDYIIQIMICRRRQANTEHTRVILGIIGMVTRSAQHLHNVFMAIINMVLPWAMKRNNCASMIHEHALISVSYQPPLTQKSSKGSTKQLAKVKPLLLFSPLV